MPYARRRCTGSPTCPAILTGSQRYCTEHAREYEVRRGSRQQRGYDNDYDRAHAAWQRVLNSGQAIYCWRPDCGERIDPTPGRWQLGHDDENRDIIRGPECPSCNTSAGGRKGAAARR